MQHTLLGLAIAFILALTAALVGPHFVDWTKLRPRFEAEATRIAGLPVRVEGEMSARLLPTPSLRLRNVEIGAPADSRTVTARQLDVEFSLGSLMRGEWRANELTANGVAADIGLDARGRLDWLTPSSGFNLASLAVDKLNLTGKLTLRDAASRASLVLEDIDFSGDVRAFGGVRGEGDFVVSGTRYPFRLSSGQAADGRGTRLRFNIEPGDRPLTADIEGVLSFESGAPRFEGGVTLGRPVALKAKEASKEATRDASQDAALESPWRIATRVKLEPTQAKFEQLDMLYGSEDAGLKLSGVADMRFGVTPQIQAVLTARQFDADRLLAQRGGGGSPAEMAKALAVSIAALPRAPLAAQLNVAAETVTLGGRPVQGIGLDLRGDANGWTVDRLEFRAPGTSRVAASGRLQSVGNIPSFKGTASLEANDPDLLMAWLQGKNEFQRSARTLKARGDITIAANSLGADALHVEMDGGAIDGRISYLATASGRSRLDADLTADRFDLDTLARLAPGAGMIAKWPDEARIWLDFGRATLLGQEARRISARLAYDDQAWTLERLGVADIGGVALEGSGALDRAAASGRMALNASAPSLDQLSALLAPVAPQLAARLRALPDRASPAGVKFAFETGKPEQGATQAAARAALEFSGPLAGTITVNARPQVAALRAFDRAALWKSGATIEGKLAAPRAATLTTLLGLDGVVATRPGAGELAIAANGALDTSMQTTLALKADALDLRAQGTVEIAKAAAKLDVTMQQANLGPLAGVARPDVAALNASLKSRVSIAGSDVRFDDVNGTVGSARVRGRGAITEAAFDGEVGLDTLDAAVALRMLIGDAGTGEPLSRGLIGRWRGKLAFSALGASLGALEMRPLAGVLKSDGDTLTLDAINGNLGGGTIKGDVMARGGGEGVALDGRLQLANVDGAVLRFAQLSLPASRVSAQLSLQAAGRSAASLIGSLSGNGTVKLESARLSGVDPAAFEAAIRASDQGVTDTARLRDVAERALGTGPLNISDVEFPLTLRAGRLRLDNTTVIADAAQLAVSGSYDIAAADLDLRASLVSLVAKGPPAAGRPEIRVVLRGPADAPVRNVDTSPLIGWIAVRAIDRETQRLDYLDRTGPPRTPMSPAPEPGPATLPAPGGSTVAVPQDAPPSIMAPGAPSAPRPAPPRRAAVPETAPLPSLPPLPPPIDVRPAPPVKRLAPPQQLVPQQTAPRPPQPIARQPGSSAF